MSSNWRVGIASNIDNGADVLPTQTPEVGNEFCDIKYIGTKTGSPSQPYGNPTESGAAVGTIFNLGCGTFTPKSGAYLYRANIKRGSTLDISNAGDQLDLDDGINEGFILLGNGVSGILSAISSLSYSGSSAVFKDCVIQGVCIDNILTAETITFNFCHIINPTELTSAGNNVNLIFNNCTFQDGTITTAGNVDLNNCNVVNTTFPNGIRDSINTNYFGVSQPTTSGTDSGNTTNDTDDENVDNLEMVIDPNSPLVGAAQNDNTQGASRLGELIDFTGGTLNDIQTSPTFSLLASSIGDATPTSKVLNRASPIIVVNGIPDDLTDETSFPIHPEMTTLLNKASTDGNTACTGSFKSALNRLFHRLEFYKVRNRFDAIWVWATNGDSAFSRYNILDPNNFQCSEVASPVFTSGQGYDDGGVNGYLDTNFNLLNDGVNYTQDSASIGFQCRTNSLTNTIEAGAVASSIFTHLSAYFSGGSLARINQASSQNVSPILSDTRGMFIHSRSSNVDTTTLNPNGVTTNGSQTSTGVPNQTLNFLRRNHTSPQNSDKQLGLGFVAGNVSDVITLIATIFDLYMFESGANVVDPRNLRIPYVRPVQVTYNDGGGLDTDVFIEGYPMYKDDLGRLPYQLGYRFQDIEDGVDLTNLINVITIQENIGLIDL